MPYDVNALIPLMRLSFGGMDGDMRMLASLARCNCPRARCVCASHLKLQAVEPQAARWRACRLFIVTSRRASFALAVGQNMRLGQLSPRQQ
jgi:hypothetical protein